ncbi:hypothetical protein GCM10009828_037550 [Actinoplanes couchii]|uniref:Uncharacterized protein n=1 Tax=Actinoplanes couchii TaxID=403638 RepID=A0ABQ3X9N5_9ACTN|nr:hypothetical protein Aco03nite_036210 [Actinoplanes couchii]
MHRALHEQRQDGGPDILPAAAASSWAAPAAEIRPRAARATGAEGESGREAEAAPAESTEALETFVRVVSMSVPHDLLRSVVDS